jgi:hypothetical protein
MKNPSNNNNSNGYVVKLTNGHLTNDINVHYNCIHYCLKKGNIEIQNLFILRPKDILDI